MPPQIPFIIGNEACERFSFYGMRNILTAFLVGWLLTNVPEGTERASAAKEVFHVFVMGVYFFPLLGGWLADRYLGKYRTIFWLSLVYCAGHACLALFERGRAGGEFSPELPAQWMARAFGALLLAGARDGTESEVVFRTLLRGVQA